MGDRFNSLWIVVFIAAAEMLHLGPELAPAAGPAAKTTTSQSRAPEPKPAASMNTGRGLLHDYYGAEPDMSRVHITIASVPDPVDSRAAYKFDEILDAIEAGAQSSGFVLDRFYLPWFRKADAGAADDKDLDTAKPGILLFHSGSETVLIFLVGETATQGIHKGALANALTQTFDLRNSTEEIRFIGPNFSGSALSLRFAFETWFKEKARPLTVHFISGNATSVSARNSLESGPNEWGKPGLTTHFHGMVWSDDYVQNAMMAYLHGLGVEDDKIAILSESDSAYGQSFLKGAYRFPFPLHISQLRTSYREDPSLKSSPVSIASDPARAALDLSFDEAANPTDIPAPFSPGPTSNLAELSLYNIIAGLNREHIRYVGLYATDTRDKLFLARLIRAYFPTMQFFTNDNDLLYTHSHYSAEMAGLLIASTYPLVNQTQTWKLTGAAVRQFSSQGAQGAFNATRAALLMKDLVNAGEVRGSDAETDQLLADPDGILVDYQDPFNVAREQSRPLIWLSAVGNERLWPIKVYSPGAKTTAEPAIENSKRSRTFLAMFGLFSGFCFLAWLVPLLLSNARPGRKTRLHTRIEEAYVSCFYLTLLLSYSVIATKAFFVRPWITWPTQFVLIGHAMIIFLLSQAAAESGLRALWPGTKRQTQQRLSIPIAAGILIGVLAWSLGVVQGGSTPYDILLAERATRLGSGVSPLVPFAFLMAGIGIWICCDLKRLKWLHYLNNANPFQIHGSPTGPAAGFVQMWIRINRTLASWDMGLDSRKLSGFALAVLAVVIAPVFLNFFTTFEGPGFDWLLRLVFVVLLIGFLVSAARFFMIWYQFRRVLQRLAFHPVADAFKRLDPKFGRGLGTHFSAAPPTLMELEESVNMLARLKHRLGMAGLSLLAHPHLAAIQARLAANYPNLERTYLNEMNAGSARTERAFSFDSRTQMLLCREAAFIFSKLEPEWTTPSADETMVQSCEDFVAVQIVAFLNYVFLHLRYLLMCTASSVVLLLLATASYPFYLQFVMMNFAWALLLALACTYLVVFTQMSRNTLIVRISSGPDGTGANRHFLSQILVFGLVPVVTFLGSTFPSLGKILFSWMTPALKAFNF